VTQLEGHGQREFRGHRHDEREIVEQECIERVAADAHPSIASVCTDSMSFLLIN
jgi:hypothetical protein